jgi:large subunit ribosomal protein L15
MPLQRRVPKFGFTNINRIEFNVINVGDIQKLIDTGKIEKSGLNKEYFLNKKIIKNSKFPLKILGNGDINSSIEISADAYSSTAKEKIEKAGGKAVNI